MSRANIDSVRESVAASPKNLTATAHRSWDSLTLFSLSLSVYPRGYNVREKLQLSNHNAQRGYGRESELL